MNTITQEIPQELWPAYFDDFNRLHEGWWVTVEVLGRELGDQRFADRLPLQGFSYETQGSEAGDILIEVGDLSPAYMIHHVDRPRVVRVADLQPGAEADIQIESEDGTTTLVCLRVPTALPPPAAGPSEPSPGEALCEQDFTVQLLDEATGQEIGRISETELAFLQDALEEEGPDDDDYWINPATVEMLGRRPSATWHLISMLGHAVGDNPDGIDIAFQCAGQPRQSFRECFQ